MKFDYSIYKKKFPSLKVSEWALAGIIVYCIIISYFGLFILDKEIFKSSFLRMIMIFLYFAGYGFEIGLFIYALVTYLNVNKNKSLNELKEIKSDEFINKVISDFISECQKSGLIISTLCVTGVSVLLDIIAMIIYFKSICRKYN